MFTRQEPGRSGMAPEALPDLPLLTGRLVRTLLALCEGGLVVDLASVPEGAPSSGYCERLTFRGRIPGLSVVAAALSSVTGWHPVATDGAEAVELYDADRRRRLRLETVPEQGLLGVEIHGLCPEPAPERTVSARKGRGKVRRQRTGSVYAWLEALRRESAVGRHTTAGEVLLRRRTGRPPLCLALHTVAEERRRAQVDSKTEAGT
ncbi:MAG: hypothetical protein D6721_07095 [Gammaproteobacteria bacterium]|nr:MAG: hypothetical protein D6721_07095 [Gammaproteobacteria bacterium]